MAMDFFDALQFTALKNVLCHRLRVPGEDDDYVVRRIFRWYSKTFATPLHEVPNLPFCDVMMAWHESNYEDVEHDHELIEEAERLLKKPEEIQEEQKAKDALKMSDDLAIAAYKAENALNALRATGVVSPKKEGKEVELPKPSVKSKIELPPNMKITFAAPDEEFDWDGNSFGILDTPKP